MSRGSDRHCRSGRCYGKTTEADGLSMTRHVGSTKHTSLQVRDQEGTAYTVRLAVAEHYETGTLAILTPTGEVAQRFELTHLKKGRDGTQLTCRVSGATVMLSLEHDKNPPELRVAASLFLPIFETTYRFSKAEQQHLAQWIDNLAINVTT
jgi:hypothetical protein